MNAMTMTTDAAKQQALQDMIDADLETFESQLAERLTGARGVIDEVTLHLANAGGKRMRPVLTFLAAHVGMPDQRVSEKIMRAALVVELTHLATLYHDDVMDSAPTRRGVDAVQKVWGNNRAILAGDVIFARASTACASLGPDAITDHATTFERLCRGQLNESFGPNEGDDPVDFYIQVLADKTGSLISQAARFGSQFSGCDDDTIEALSDYGEKIGVAFQIADDVLDIMSDGDVSGKTPGTDLKEGVDTLPTLLLRRHLAQSHDDPDGQRILQMIDDGIDDDATLAQVVALLRHHPVLDETRELAKTWSKKAKDALKDLPDSTAKTALFEFADVVVDRVS